MSSEARSIAEGTQEHKKGNTKAAEFQNGLRVTEAMKNRGGSAPSLKHLFNLRDVLTLLREHRLLKPRDTKAAGIPVQVQVGRNLRNRRVSILFPN